MGVVIPNFASSTEDRVSGAQVVDGSLRFDSSKTHYLSRTPSSTGNRRTWTFSFWTKRGLGQKALLSVNSTSNSKHVLFRFESNDTLRFAVGYTVAYGFTTTQVFRDPNAWYHIVLAFDATASAGSAKVKIYVNGTEITTFSADTRSSIVDQDWGVNEASIFHVIGRNGTSAVDYYDGHLNNVYLIDGYALGPEQFGYTDLLTGTWRPKVYDINLGTYVNNGTVWSDDWGGTGSTGNVDNPTNAFDGSLSNYTSNQNSNTICNWVPSSPIPVKRSLRVYAAAISSGADQVFVNGTSLGTIPGSTPQWYSIQATQLTSVGLQDIGATHGRLYAIEVDGVILVNSSTSNSTEASYPFGTNGFYLPMDGNSPIGQDKSGQGNDWTPVNFGGSNTLEKATGALPILNTDGGGKVARVGVRTDSNASSLVLALPLVGIKSDFSNAINSGTSNKAITANGNAAASSAQSNFYGGSWYFDGTGDYLSFNSQIIPSTNGDFTIEMMVYLPSSLSVSCLLLTQGTTGNAGRFEVSINTSRQISISIGGVALTSTTTFPLQTWAHLAWIRSSGTIYLAVNGVVENKGSLTTSPQATTTYFGSAPGWVTDQDFPGYVQDLRVYTSAKYTQNFIPASTDPDILPDTPSGVSGSSKLTKITDGAVSFDGSGDYLSIPTSTDFAFGTGDFTIEFYTYLTKTGQQHFYEGRNGSATNTLLINVDGSTQVSLYVNSAYRITGQALSTGRWYHIALSRSGTSTKLFVDGVQTGSTYSDTTDYAAPTGSLFFGVNDVPNSSYLQGFLSNVRIVKGTALYTSNFTPPTSPLTSVANTKLLCCKSPTSATAYEVSPGTITSVNAVASNFNPFTTDINTVRGQESGYCTWNPLDKSSQTNIVLTNGNLDAANTSSSGQGRVDGTIAISSGKWYFEAKVTGSSSFHEIGVIKTDQALSYGIGFYSGGYSYIQSGNKFNNNADSSYGSSYTIGDTIGVSFDLDNGTLVFYKNGVSQGTAFTGLSGEFTLTLGTYSSAANFGWSSNFGQKPFKFPPPDGFQPLNSSTVRPSTVIARPNQYVGVIAYSGNGGTQSISELNFNGKPDFVWIKNRTTNGYNHMLYDSVRGAGSGKALSSDQAVAEGSAGDGATYGYMSSFDRDGFTVVRGSDATSLTNGSGQNYVAWAWKAGGNSNTFNIDDVGYATAEAAGLTAGTITPTGASVNTKSGFSIITYTGNGTSGATVSHGLNDTPKFFFLKSRTAAYNWIAYHSALGNTKVLLLDSTSAALTATHWWNDSGPSSTTFTLGNTVGTNASGVDFVAYCWADVPGLQKFGSYVGNSSTDGPFIELGFRPALVMLKAYVAPSTSVTGWVIQDSERGSYNVINSKQLYANASYAEGKRGDGSATNPQRLDIDFLSNGFKLRDIGNEINATGYSYIYAAWAEAPTFNLFGAQANAR